MISVSETTLRAAYQLVSEFLDALNRSDAELLKSKFDINGDVYQQIQTDVKELFWYENEINFSLEPLESILESGFGINFYGEEDEEKCWGLDCYLLNNGKRAEGMIIFDLFKDGDRFWIKFLCIDNP
ncbi:hypothetical protein AGMMS49521_2260 [Campylobacterota bacterium]|nr:hypothetical protein AGMMS49521_2260 [Campylobacterota bacterium]